MISVNQVEMVIKMLGPVLGLRVEPDVDSVEKHIKLFSLILGVEEASQVVQRVVYEDSCIASIANSGVVDLSGVLTEYSYKQAIDKLVSIQSVLVAVSILILVHEAPNYANWLYLTGLKVIGGDSNSSAMIRLNAVVNYIVTLQRKMESGRS